MATCSGYYANDTSTNKMNESIEVMKGSPQNARYAIFYAMDEDPVIFCKTYDSMKRELKKLRKREDVKQKSIRVFRLVRV